jgi:hypothetical protein
MRRALRGGLTIVGLACLVVFGSFDYHGEVTTSSQMTHVRIGLDVSPWYEWTEWDTPGRTEKSGGMRFVSWSWAVFVVGVGMLYGAWRLRPAKTPPSTEPERQP